MEEKISVRPHRLTIDNRASSTMTGIRDVVSFDENQVVLDTDMGLLTLKGKDLHVSRLTLEKGEVDLNGTIESLLYSSNEALRRSGESLLSRLFK
ncbi:MULTISPECIES: sporulation protein YabP [Lacrimispora]|jgi:sporulation protein YabP|uniref:Sporulation protein YabP n=2 Tax=Lacrimispora TaxID=2719231 RepID=A0A2S6HY34_9FIRM|nr:MULTISPECIES: sporulation protein YabP [Clostridia]MBE5977347.1 sporulation protein YabP [Paenibacillaceae bacterium]MTK05825.1 sporulation protein YabP [Hungatella sp.]MBE5981269.1 sporulation protein YabP [Paenibacillaceae bacterium]MBE5982023.1 sporulation protein YabP [Paenibacillaceae bacterium]MBE5986619.1 sporulation protein YabP [Paenibacillaceae bacterium]